MIRSSRPLLLAAAVVALALLGAAAAVLLGARDRAREGAAPEPVPTQEPAVPSPVHDMATVAAGTEPERSGAQAPALPELPARGTVEVRIVGLASDAATGAVVQAVDWRSHAGAGLSIRARADVPAGGDRATLHLPSGSFSVSARSAGLASAARRVELDVRRPYAQIVLDLVACGAVHGVLLQHDGRPAADVPVHLEDSAGQWLGSARSGHDGGYALECIPLGACRLLVGVLSGPLLSPIEVEVLPAPQRVPDVVLPPMGRIAIEVRDEFGALVPDLALEGRGDSSVRLELRSDMGGTARCELVPPGAWRIYADAGPLGRGNVLFDVSAGAEVLAELRLRR